MKNKMKKVIEKVLLLFLFNRLYKNEISLKIKDVIKGGKNGKYKNNF